MSAGGPLYVSRDYGRTWVEDTSVGNQQWSSITLSADGLSGALLVDGGLAYQYRLSIRPTRSPTLAPSSGPTFTPAPTSITASPSRAPTAPTSAPTAIMERMDVIWSLQAGGAPDWSVVQDVCIGTDGYVYVSGWLGGPMKWGDIPMDAAGHATLFAVSKREGTIHILCIFFEYV